MKQRPEADFYHWSFILVMVLSLLLRVIESLMFPLQANNLL